MGGHPFRRFFEFTRRRTDRRKTTDMPTKKNVPTPGKTEVQTSAAYDAALTQYVLAIELLGKKDFAAARDLFNEAVVLAVQEPELTQCARSYATICERQLAPAQPDPAAGDERYARAVFLSNAGRWDDALSLLDQAIAEDPTSVRNLYARACAWALKGSTSNAVTDLRQAIAGDPTVRFQAVNDPDFEKIREEPTFIDIIEPTPTGP
jgi:tetratricopeptide (TPR) repeat protein